MKTIGLAFCLITLCGIDPASDPGIESLIAAEKSFAAMAHDTNTRDAFLQYFSDDVVTALRGKGPHIGKDHLKAQAVNESLLSWTPTYCALAGSGDFGYNTGPWKFYPSKTDKEPVAWGQFVSVWKKDSDGKWRVAVDMGINHGNPGEEPPLNTHRVSANQVGQTREVKSIMDHERAYIEALQQRSSYARHEHASRNLRVLRPGRQPEQVVDESEPGKFAYTPMAAEESPTHDLAYVYGKATTNNEEVYSYLRIWEREEGRWKLVVDLITD